MQNKQKTTIILVIVLALVGGSTFVISRNKTSKTPSTNEQTNEMVGTAQPSAQGRYVPYTHNAFESAKDKKRVLYFHAAWCPTCKVLDRELSENESQIPQDLIIFKTDYDTEKELKTKHTITYQHTLVFVDQDGNEIAKWNGGGLAEIIENTTQ